MCQLTGVIRPLALLAVLRWLATSFPEGVDQINRRVQDAASDNEQNGPYQIVDLPPQIGRGLLHRLRSPEEGRLQEQDDRDRRNQDGDELIHISSHCV